MIKLKCFKIKINAEPFAGSRNKKSKLGKQVAAFQYPWISFKHPAVCLSMGEQFCLCWTPF